MRLAPPRFRRSLWILLLVAAVTGGGAGFAHWYARNWPWHHFRTVVAGRLYRTGQPTAGNVHTAVADYGVKTIVNLRGEDERGANGWYAAEVAATAAQGAAHIDVPIACSQPPSAAQIDQLLALFEDPARQPVLVHCEFGSVRSGAVEALYRMEELGEDNATAIARTEWWGHDMTKEEPRIMQFLRDYAPRRQRHAPPAGGER